MDFGEVLRQGRTIGMVHETNRGMRVLTVQTLTKLISDSGQREVVNQVGVNLGEGVVSSTTGENVKYVVTTLALFSLFGVSTAQGKQQPAPPAQPVTHADAVQATPITPQQVYAATGDRRALPEV